MANFICPVQNARLTSKFGWRDIGRGKEWHQGVDLAGKTPGSKVPVYASASGKVTRVGKLGTYGNVVMILHTIGGKTYETNYAHLDSYKVKVGQQVKQGEQIGIMGNTGGSFGVHLHFEIHNGRWATGQPNAVDPMKYISLTDSKVPEKPNNNPQQSEELTMSQYNELKQLITALQNENKQLKAELAKKLDAPIERSVSASHKDAWKWLTDKGILNGKNPEQYLSREQMATVLQRFDKEVVKK